MASRFNFNLRSALAMILFVALAFSCDTSSNVDPVFEKYFIKTYGTFGDQEGVDFVVNADNTVTILGNSIHPDGERFIFFLKIDKNGDVLTEKEINIGEIAKDIEPIPGGYIILSNIQISPSRYDFKLTKVDEEGVEISSVIFNSLGDQFGNSITVVSDGRFFVSGNTRDTDLSLNADLPDNQADLNDLLIVEFDNSLQVLNTFRIGKSSDGLSVKVLETADGFIYGGFSDEIYTGNTPNYNCIFRSFVNDPRNVGTLYIGDDVDQEKLSSFIKMPGGYFFAIGTATLNGNINTIFIANILKGTSVPVKILTRNIGNSRLEGITGSASQSGAYVYVVANETSATDDTKNVRLYKINSITGEEVWSSEIGAEGNDDVGNAVAELSDGSVMVLATVNLINQHKIAVIRLNDRGGFTE